MRAKPDAGFPNVPIPRGGASATGSKMPVPVLSDQTLTAARSLSDEAPLRATSKDAKAARALAVWRLKRRSTWMVIDCWRKFGVIVVGISVETIVTKSAY